MKKCFMGDCKKLYDENDPCEDIEAQQGKWGRCHEFEPYDESEECDEGEMENYTILLRTDNGLLQEGLVSARNSNELAERIKQLETGSKRLYAVLRRDVFQDAVISASEMRR